jgi:hypothetical protein
MTINKSQGQTLEYVGMRLTESMFSDGQLYFAVSQVTDDRNLRMRDEARREAKIKNIVTILRNI